jgi:hypothetical protein
MDYYVKRSGKYLMDSAHTYLWTTDKSQAKIFNMTYAYIMAAKVKGTTEIVKK